ncbi:unnamed protein product [Prunus armeniaca]|uniref:Lipid desaturase domain-containing protein n=1 Tax=Prunus armeniaca TaxID=36596 RepID=A0A6J5UP61_PRUAR|nr:unnamed protein product [Prunus armeniaca]
MGKTTSSDLRQQTLLRISISTETKFRQTPTLSTSMICSFTTNIKPSADNLVIRGAIRPQLNDPSLLSTWSHRAWVACGFTMVLVSLTKSIIGVANSHIWLEPILAGLMGYVLADLGSGIYHWGIDNYGSALTPIVAAQIEAFQGHHKWPRTITRRQFANNLHVVARVVTFHGASYRRRL